MHDVLIKYLNSYIATPLKTGEIGLVRDAFIAKKLKKRQYFLEEGEVCGSTAFVVKGAMRKYRVGDKGGEYIVSLYLEDGWAYDLESFSKGLPSDYFIDAWEKTECLAITNEDLMALLDRVQSLNTWMLKLNTDFAIAEHKRIEAAISLSSEGRLQELEKTHPEFLQRFPQHVIASYLGINRETLSRIRSRSMKKMDTEIPISM